MHIWRCAKTSAENWNVLWSVIRNIIYFIFTSLDACVLISRKLYWIFVHKYKGKMDAAARCEFPKGIQIIQTTVSVNVYNWSDEGPKEVCIKYISSLSSSGHKSLLRKKTFFSSISIKIGQSRVFFLQSSTAQFSKKKFNHISMNTYKKRT